MRLLQYSSLIPILFALPLLVFECDGAPEPRNFLFTERDLEVEGTTQLPEPESVTSGEFVVLEEEPAGDVIAQPSETNDVVASASSQSSSSATANALSGNSGGKITLTPSQQANIILLQQLQQQLQRQQQLQQQTQNQPQQQAPNQPQQFSLDALVKSVVKMMYVAKTKIDQGARTFRDILQLFDRKKYVNIIPQSQASETNLITT